MMIPDKVGIVIGRVIIKCVTDCCCYCSVIYKQSHNCKPEYWKCSRGSDVLPSERQLRPRHSLASGVDTGEKCKEFFQRAFNAVEDLLVSAGEAQVDSNEDDDGDSHQD
jgi:hypothetical protein